MKTQITKQQAEQILEGRFKSKYVKFHYPGYKPVFGRCDRICIGEGKKDAGLILIFIGDNRYRISPESLKECLTLINQEDGITHTGRTNIAERSP